MKQTTPFFVPICFVFGDSFTFIKKKIVVVGWGVGVSFL